MDSLRYFFLVITISISFVMMAQITFSFNDGIQSGALKDKMESGVSQLLTEITRAGKTGTNLNLSNIPIEPEAKSRLLALYEDLTIICSQTINRSRCLEDYQGYQIREIPVHIIPKDIAGTPSNRELTISLNKTGTITGVRLSWELEEGVNSILSKSSNVSDARERYEILKWVEDFRCYYNEKNINALRQIYSDDALIITGSVVKSQKRTGDFNKLIENNATFKVQSKEQYISKLATIFKNNRRINVEFADIEVRRHGSRPHIYGVTLKQKWSSGSYQDSGWLFLLWDFNNPEYPQIYVRTWQPSDMSKDELPNVYSFPYAN